jgi:hypothetical protein
MSARADIRWSTEQYPRHCFADISVDHHEFGRWHYRNELRGKNASPLLPVVDADIVPEGFGPGVGDEVSWQPSKFLRKILRHFQFPALIVGATYARHNATTMRGARASELASQEREYLVSRFGTNATGERA